MNLAYVLMKFLFWYEPNFSKERNGLYDSNPHTLKTGKQTIPPKNPENLYELKTSIFKRWYIYVSVLENFIEHTVTNINF